MANGAEVDPEGSNGALAVSATWRAYPAKATQRAHQNGQQRYCLSELVENLLPEKKGPPKGDPLMRPEERVLVS